METSTKPNEKYTAEQKEQVRQMLSQRIPQKEIIIKTGVGKGTIAKISSSLKVSKQENQTESTGSTSQNLKVFKDELEVVAKERIEIETLLNGVLQERLDKLQQRERLLNELVQTYENL